MTYETVRCNMGDDYYSGAYCYDTPDGKYQVPKVYFDRWMEAEEAWKKAQDEMGGFMERNPPPFEEPGALSKALMDLYSDQIIASLRPLPEWIKNAGH